MVEMSVTGMSQTDSRTTRFCKINTVGDVRDRRLAGVSGRIRGPFHDLGHWGLSLQGEMETRLPRCLGILCLRIASERLWRDGKRKKLPSETRQLGVPGNFAWSERRTNRNWQKRHRKQQQL